MHLRTLNVDLGYLYFRFCMTLVCQYEYMFKDSGVNMVYIMPCFNLYNINWSQTFKKKIWLAVTAGQYKPLIYLALSSW